MSKILLINPPFNIAKENYDSSISVGLLSIATYLNSQGVQVEIIDGARQRDYLELIQNKVDDFDYVGISVMTTQISHALEISRLVKEKNPNCKIIWGGTHPTFFIRQTIQEPLIDIVCVGEGELTALDIVQGKPLDQIKGIAYKENGDIKFTSEQTLHDPTKMPLFKWELMSQSILNNLAIIPSLTTRGCPHHCTFCLNAILKNRWRARTAEQVLQDLEIIESKDYFKGKPLRFWDENFFVDINRAKDIINGILERKLTIPWETTVRAAYIREGMVDHDLLSKLKESGCYLLSFGAESGSQRILDKIKKDITPEDVLRSAKMCLEHGITPQYSFMIGLPGELKEDMKMTLNLIDKLVKLSDKVQILGPQAFRPYPGSELYKECLESGWQAPNTAHEWAHLVENELSYLTVQNFPWVKHKDFVESMEAYVRFGALSIKSAMGSTIRAQKLVKLIFVLICKLRWKLKFFAFPIEFKLAKRFVTRQA